MPLTLLVPDLLPPDDAPQAMRSLRLPRLEIWLARAAARREGGTGSAWLLRQWGLGAQAPVAALGIAADGGSREGYWLRADPVHQRVDRDRLVVHGASVLSLTRQEADAAVGALNAFFAPDGLEFVAPAEDRWYVRVPPGEAPRTVPVEEVLGRDPFGMLPEGGGGLNWPSLFCEAQMLLASLAFNTDRESQGLPTLNAVWFWGGGSYPQGLPRPFASVFADDILARSLAVAGNCAIRPLPSEPAQLPVGEPGAHLVVLDALSAPFCRGGGEEWIAAAKVLERDWFSRLGDALASFGHLRIVLPATRDTAVFELRPWARWRLLRRPRPLADHA